MPARTIGRVASTAPPRTWILTGSPENFAVTRELGLGLVGLKERHRRLALEIERGDRIVYYITRVMAFAASARVTGELFEDRTPVWPGKPGKVDPYPWRFEAEPELLLDEPDWVPAESLADSLEHTRKWPREHWTLAFQGQLRSVSEADAELLVDQLRSASTVHA
jgi:EVE domain